MNGGQERRALAEALRRAARGARAGLGPVSRALRSSARTCGNVARTVIARHLDGGFDGNPPSGAGAADGLELIHLSVAYGRRVAVKDVSGVFAPATLTALVGPNGGGKSSLLKTIAGIIKPRSGKIVLSPLGRRRLAYMPQQAEIDQSFPISVSELVALGSWRRFGAFRATPAELERQVETAIAGVGLGDLAATPIAELSPGQFRRALFARLIVQDAGLVLLDEPFAAVDEETTGDLLGLMQRWQQEGRTVVAVLHDIGQVRSHFPTTLLLACGVIGWGATETVLTQDNLARAAAALRSRQQTKIAA